MRKLLLWKKKKKLAGVQIICRIKNTTKQLLEFVLVLLMLITRPILEHKKITLLILNLANVILVNSLIKFTLNYLVTNNGRRKEVKIKKEGKKVLAAGFRIHCFSYHKKQYTSYSRFPFNFIVSKSLLWFNSVRTLRVLVLLLPSSAYDVNNNNG